MIEPTFDSIPQGSGKPVPQACSHRAEVLFDFLLEQLEKQPNEVALEAIAESVWTQWTWSQLAAEVEQAGKRLLTLGIEPGDRVATWSENRWEWIVWDGAMQGVGAVHVPLHAALPASQVTDLLEHSGARGVLVSSAMRRDLGMSLQAADRWSCDIALPSHSRESLEASAAASDLHRRLLAWRKRQLPADAMTTLIYTSGTTGRPKGVMLSQTNLVSNVYGKLEAIELFADDVRYAMLPMTHVFARLCDLATWLAAGCRLIVGSGKEHWFDEIRQCRPTYLNSVPLFYHRLWQQAGLEGRRNESGVLREMLGGRIRVCNCGGAPLPDVVFDWFVEQGITLITGYGLTESSPVLTSSSPHRMKRGAVGTALSNVELRLTDEGEVCARGPNIMLGYYRDPDLTKQTLPGGWLATGDLGQLDEQGFLTLVGRKKELIVTPGGLKIVPTEIERRMVELDWISQAFVTSDEAGHPCGLIVPQPEELAKLAPQLARSLAAGQQLETWTVNARPSQIQNAAETGSFAESKSLENENAANESNASESQRLRAALEQERTALVEHLKAITFDLPKYWGLWRCSLESIPFSLEEGTLTAKGSLRRSEIEKRRSDALRRLLRSIDSD